MLAVLCWTEAWLSVKTSAQMGLQLLVLVPAVEMQLLLRPRGVQTSW
jgi:hypothetical protein